MERYYNQMRAAKNNAAGRTMPQTHENASSKIDKTSDDDEYPFG